MSNSEYGNISPVYTKDFILDGGVRALDVANFFLCNSQVVSIERIVSSGGTTTGDPYVLSTVPVPRGDTPAGKVPGQCTITLASSKNTDTSTYRLKWINNFTF